MTIVKNQISSEILDFLAAFLTALFLLPLAKVASWKWITIRIHFAITFTLTLTFSKGNINIAIMTAILITIMLMIDHLPRAEDEDASSEERKDASAKDEGVPVVKVRRLHELDRHDYEGGEEGGWARWQKAFKL